jgi:hypothetical protein
VAVCTHQVALDNLSLYADPRQSLDEIRDISDLGCTIAMVKIHNDGRECPTAVHARMVLYLPQLSNFLRILNLVPFKIYMLIGFIPSAFEHAIVLQIASTTASFVPGPAEEMGRVKA